MFTNIMIGLLAYILCITLFLVGWKRWQDRMAHLDADTTKALAPEWVEWHPGTERSTKTGEVRRIK